MYCGVCTFSQAKEDEELARVRGVKDRERRLQEEREAKAQAEKDRVREVEEQLEMRAEEKASIAAVRAFKEAELLVNVSVFTDIYSFIHSFIKLYTFHFNKFFLPLF